MRRLNLLAGVATFTAILTLPTVAAIGQQTPSNPEVDQYLPTVPGDKGDVGVGGGGGGGSAGGGGGGAAGGGGGGSNDGGSPAPGTRKELGSQSSSQANGGGSGATQGAGSQDAGGGVLRRSKESDGDDGTSEVAAAGDSQSPVSPPRDASAGDDDEGLGILFPVLLAAIAAGGIALALKRRSALRRG